MWIQLFWLGSILDVCMGSGFWWWYVDEVVNIWCSQEYDCKIDGKTYLNSACVNSPARGRFRDNYAERYHLNDQLRKTILKLHNSQRDSAAAGTKGLPKASNMRQMTWDDDLEEVARRTVVGSAHAVVNRQLPLLCKAKCFKTRNFEKVGRICFPILAKDSEVNTTVVDDVTSALGHSMNGEVIKSFKDDPDYGPLGRMLWAETYKVGCADLAFGFFKANSTPQPPSYRPYPPDKVKFYRQFICLYGPAGGIENQPVYREGEQCSACPTDTQCRKSSIYKNLCAKKGDPEDDGIYGKGTLPELTSWLQLHSSILTVIIWPVYYLGDSVGIK